MPDNLKLQEKTYDQQLRLANGETSSFDISPNTRVPCEVVLEPVATGIRVTARDDQHRTLWGYVGAEDKLKQTHCLVAVYDTLQNLLAVQLEKGGYCKRQETDPISEALIALDRLDKTVKWIRDSLDVKKVSDATAERAKTIAQIISDADQQITLEAATLKGMKSKSD
jgi:hypothetical protein